MKARQRVTILVNNENEVASKMNFHTQKGTFFFKRIRFFIEKLVSISQQLNSIIQKFTSISQQLNIIIQKSTSIFQQFTSNFRRLNSNFQNLILAKPKITTDFCYTTSKNTPLDQKYPKTVKLIIVMAMNKEDWIPIFPEPKFKAWEDNYYEKLLALSSTVFNGNDDFLASLETLEDLKGLYNDLYDVAGPEHELTRTSLQTKAKIAQKKLLIAHIRLLNRTFIRLNPKITEVMRGALIVPNYDTVRSPRPIPVKNPVLVNYNSPDHYMLFLDIREKGNIEKKAMNYLCAEIHGLTVTPGVAMPNPDNFVLIDYFTKHLVKYTVPTAFMNKMLFFRLRFSNGPNKKGPWSDVYSVIIT